MTVLNIAPSEVRNMTLGELDAALSYYAKQHSGKMSASLTSNDYDEMREDLKRWKEEERQNGFR